MIVSHEHKFIFIHVRKTAGTSLQVLFDGIAGRDAIVTPIAPTAPGYVPRNYERRFNPLPQIVRTRRVRGPIKASLGKRAFPNHVRAQLIRERLGRRTWNSYYKFCFERDPWDKVISWYYFKRNMAMHRVDMDFDDFVMNEELPTDFDLYSINGSIAVDFVGRYESLDSDLASILDRLGIRNPPELSRQKSEVRPPDSSVESLFTPALNARVASVFAREIAALGYPDRSRRLDPGDVDVRRDR